MTQDWKDLAEFYGRTLERLLLKTLKNRRHSWIGHTVRHNEFVGNVLEGAISGKKGRGKTWTAILKSKSPDTQELTVIQQ